MKKLICVVLTLFSLYTTAFAVPVRDNSVTAFDISSSWQTIFDDAPVTVQELSQMSLMDMLRSGFGMVRDKLTAPLRLFAKICALLLFAAIARSMCPADTGGNLYHILEIIIALAVFSLCAAPILQTINEMLLQIEECRVSLASFVPVFASVLIGCGQIGTAAVYSGFFFTGVMLISGFLCNWMLPGLKILLAFSIVGSVCDALNFSKISTFFVKLSKWSLTICATVFVSVLSLQSALSASADSLAMKTGKMLVSASVPVIGRAVSDAMSSVYAGLKLLKGTAGIALVGMVVLAFLPVLAQCAAYYFVLLCASLVAEVTGGVRSAKLFNGLGEVLSLSMLFVFFFCLMTVLSTILMVVAGSG